MKDRGMDLSYICPCCRMDDKTMGHILFQHPSTIQVWHLINFLPAIAQLEASVQTFVEMLEWSASTKASRLSNVKAVLLLTIFG